MLMVPPNRESESDAGETVIVPRSISEYKSKNRDRATQISMIARTRFVLSSRLHTAVFPPAAGFEQRLGDLEAQIERLTLALVRWRESEEHRQPIERRLAVLTEQCADILKQWTATSERHALAVGELESRLSGWTDIESRLQRDASTRFRDLERTIEREWAALRHLHEEPVRELREQAQTLAQISVNAAGSAQTGLERAEARLATIEHDLHRRMDELSRDIHAALAELRQQHGDGHSPATSWSLDEVTRLHHELREGAAAADAAPPTALERRPDPAPGFAPRAIAPVMDVGDAPVVPPNDGPSPSASEAATAAAIPTPIEPAPDLHESQPAFEQDAGSSPARGWYAAVTLLAVAVAVVAAFALNFYGKANQAAERAAAAQQRAEGIAATANARIEAARKDAATQVAQALDAASKAQVVTDVLAAPDLVRFNLLGGDATTRVSGQLLWSRSRGMVFTASRMPQPRAQTVYQVWLLTAGEPVNGGVVVPDSSGRVSVATDTPPTVPRPLVGVRVTSEPAPGSAAPTGPTILGRTS